MELAALDVLVHQLEQDTMAHVIIRNAIAESESWRLRTVLSWQTDNAKSISWVTGRDESASWDSWLYESWSWSLDVGWSHEEQ